MHTGEDAIRQFLQRYEAAVFNKDVDAFAALYDPSARIFDMWGVWLHADLGAWRDMARAWFDSLGSELVKVSFGDVHTCVAPGLAVAHAFVSYAAIDVDGTELRSLQNRMSVVLALKGASWLVIHEHTSSPVDPATGKVLLDR